MELCSMLEIQKGSNLRIQDFLINHFAFSVQSIIDYELIFYYCCTKLPQTQWLTQLLTPCSSIGQSLTQFSLDWSQAFHLEGLREKFTYLHFPHFWVCPHAFTHGPHLQGQQSCTSLIFLWSSCLSLIKVREESSFSPRKSSG